MVRTVLHSHLYVSSLIAIVIFVKVATSTAMTTLNIDLILRGSSLGLSHHLLLLLYESSWHDHIHWVMMDADTGTASRTLVKQPILLHPAQAVDRSVPFSLLTRVAKPFCHRVIMVVEDLHFG